ncbi:MAG: hypothetical protein U0441_39190 [Polyangiaceae bacterium]
MGDADITLRHITRRHAEALVRPYVAGEPAVIVGWADTQVTATERRLDKTLLLRLAGELLALEIEFEYRYEKDLPDRVHDYQALSRIAFQGERSDRKPPPMDTVVILLTGPRKRLADERSVRTGWPSRPFSGTRFRIDAVYQRTMAELQARGSPFWLVFTPLAPDATLAAMRDVVAAIRVATPNGDERWELFAALLVIADIDPWGHNLRMRIEAMIRDEPTDMIQVSKTLRDAYELGQREGREEGIEKGREEGIEKGREEGIKKMLRGLFARRLHRALTPPEQRALAARAAVDPDQIQEKALALEGEALSAWLLASAADLKVRARRQKKEAKDLGSRPLANASRRGQARA